MTDVIQALAGTRSDHGGTSRSVPLLCEALQQQVDIRVRFMTTVPSADTDAKPILPDHGVDVRVVEERSFIQRTFRSPFTFYQALRDLCRASTPDLIHDHGAWLPSNWSAARVARDNEVPLVVSPRGMMTSWALQHHGWKKRLAWLFYQKTVFEQASLFHVTAREEAIDLRNLGFDQPVAVIPNGVVLPDEVPPSSDDGPRRVLFLSRIHPKKGVPILLEAWAAVRPQGWILEIVGPNENNHRRDLEEQAALLDIDDDVIFSGPVADDAKWHEYAAADLFVLPSHSENFGIVVAEALAARTPVITTKGTPWSDLVEHDCGWWVDPSVDHLADALSDATSRTKEERSRMGVRGRWLVEENYSWNRVARQLKRAYTWLLDGGARPDCIRTT